MGWRAEKAYEEAEREREREFAASLSPRERLRLRIWQICSVGILICVFLLVIAYGFAAQGQTFSSKLRNAKQFHFEIGGIDKEAKACGISEQLVREAFSYPASSAAFAIGEWTVGMPTITIDIIAIHAAATKQCFSAIEFGVTTVEEVHLSFSNVSRVATISLWRNAQIHFSHQDRHGQLTRNIVEQQTKRFITDWNLDNKK